uniref:Uncharacterized protein n=1 Tax=Lepeophtheirus salmonis TaxID=72036 RepID=A0A0K2TMG7_LEPSM
MGLGIKYGHQLSHQVLFPQPIEKNKVSLSLKLYHDSTIEALKHYESSNDFKKAYLETAMLFKIFRKFWNCVNVNSLISSIKLRDERMPPITHENREQIDFLLSLYTWLKSQQDMSLHKKGLSSETFLAALQTSRGLDELSNYLLNETEAKYILLRKIYSDPL